jgi:hypothetical protein
MRKCFHEKKVPLRSRTKISVVTLASSQGIKLKFNGMRIGFMFLDYIQENYFYVILA